MSSGETTDPKRPEQPGDRTLQSGGSGHLAPGFWFADRYEVKELLGEGGMGAVYRVIDKELDEPVALKVLRAEIATAEGALERFRREVKLARRVTHANVARTYDFGIHRNTRYLTMELVAGQPLSRIGGRGRKLSLAESLRIVGEIARGLAAAHAVGVVHRDLKPDNVMIAQQRVVITDFGIARLSESASPQEANKTVGGVFGTPSYMAPEQLEGRPLDGRADVYALGVLLYELLLGERPFEGETVFALAAERLAGTVPDPRARDASIPEPIAALVMRAMARRREDRPDAQQVLQAVEAMRGEARGLRLDAEVTRIPSQNTPTGPRTLSLLPLTAIDGREQADDLASAIRSALASVPNVRVLIGRAPDADLLLDGSVRAAAARVRVRLQLVDARTAAQLWGESFEGTREDPFALEDRVVSAVVDAVRLRTGGTARGPKDPETRALYDLARRQYQRHDPIAVDESVELFRKAHARSPDDPWVLSALGAALIRRWRTQGGYTNDLIEAEEISLRALALDATIGETYLTIGALRMNQGKPREAARAMQEAVARSPRNVEAHATFARLLIECGHLERGASHIDLAMQIDPLPQVVWERCKLLTYLGEREASHQLLRRMLEGENRTVMVMPLSRFSLWWRDAAIAREAIAVMEANSGAAKHWEFVRPGLLVIAGELPLASAVSGMRAMLDQLETHPTQRMNLHQAICELAAAMGDRELALDEMAKAADLPLVDVTWMDRCPSLDDLRSDARFAQARAMVAARAATVFS